ncbi:MAG: DnaB-like helicase C-terminal domain-containing protein [Deltaproteobacteria bacterium]|nr:DnaB-like helicase C-terminal domain-containing protein [Deltaproteobacteria bacterium]
MPEKIEARYVPMADAVRDFGKELDAQGESDFFPTGFQAHDLALGRLRGGSVTWIGARPSMGKTALMLSWALAQLMIGIKVYFFSLEMPRTDMIARLVSIETGIPLLDILQRRYTDEQAREIVGTLPILSPLPGNWSEDGNLKRIAELFKQIEPRSRSIVYVDFLGLIQVTGLDASQQYAVTTEAGLALKRAAMNLQIPVVAGVQLNRQVELRKEKHPILSDFRDSGRVEEIGDLCLGLYRPGFYDNNGADTELQVFCLKNRNGPRVNYVLEWHGPCARVTEK